MATVIAVPTLSLAGWIKTPAEKIDQLITYFVYTIGNQTTIYGKYATSFQQILEANMGNMDNTVAATRAALNTYLKRYYDSVSIDVSYTLSDPTNSASLATISIAATVTEGDLTYSIEKALTTVNGKFQQFVDTTNADS